MLFARDTIAPGCQCVGRSESSQAAEQRTVVHCSHEYHEEGESSPHFALEYVQCQDNVRTQSGTTAEASKAACNF